jgi:hypothetical protein
MADEIRAETAKEPSSVELPAPTVWPIVFAFGLTLLFTGLLTSVAVSLVGVVLSLAGSIGWFREVLPQERHEIVPVEAEVVETRGVPVEVARMRIDPEIKRTRIPVEIYPFSAGIKGGLAGGVAMALLACLYGLLSHTSIWYPINLLASIVYGQSTQLSMAQLTAFHPMLLGVATLMHIVASVLVGLLYGVMLPMFPRRPINRVVQGHRRSAFAVRAVAARAVLFEEDVEIQQLVRANHLRARPGTAGRVAASGHHESRHHPGEPGPETYARTREVHRWSLRSFSLMIPGASIPARTAKGRNCRVLTRCWRTTTSPATTPNAI